MKHLFTPDALDDRKAQERRGMGSGADRRPSADTGVSSSDLATTRLPIPNALRMLVG